MAYLNLDLDYLNHPKVRRLVGLLGPGAEMYPIRLWLYCGKYHTEKGAFYSHATSNAYSIEEIEGIAEWRGEKGKMFDAMLVTGLIEKNGVGYAVHDWKDHAGHLAAFKKRAKSAAKKRWKKYATSNAKDKITNAPILTLPTLPNLSLPNKELKEKNKETDVGANVSKPKRRTRLPDEVWVKELEENPIYSGIDVQKELGKCLVWFKNKGKTVSRDRFLSWLNRADKPMTQEYDQI